MMLRWRCGRKAFGGETDWILKVVLGLSQPGQGGRQSLGRWGSGTGWGRFRPRSRLGPVHDRYLEGTLIACLICRLRRQTWPCLPVSQCLPLHATLYRACIRTGVAWNNIGPGHLLSSPAGPRFHKQAVAHSHCLPCLAASLTRATQPSAKTAKVALNPSLKQRPEKELIELHMRNLASRRRPRGHLRRH
jgi:hypothetical protein